MEGTVGRERGTVVRQRRDKEVVWRAHCTVGRERGTVVRQRIF